MALQSLFWVPADEPSVAAVRREVLALAAQWKVPLDADLRYELSVIVSELTTNAIIHTKSAVLGIGLAYHPDGRLRFEVHDTGGELPVARSARADDEAGRGLLLVAALAARHGAALTRHGKTSWAEIETDAAVLMGARRRTSARTVRKAPSTRAGLKTRRQMPEPRILAASGPLDATADFVIDELNRRGVPLARIDVGAFPDTVCLSASCGPEGWRGEITSESRQVTLEDLRAIYWRRPSNFPAESVQTGAARDYASREARNGMMGVLYALPDVSWSNHPLAVAACTKPGQLTAFAHAGLPFPATWIGNAPTGHGSFCMQGPTLSKTLGPIGYEAPDGYQALYATHVPVEHHGHERARATANHLQREIEDKAAEYRVAVVADRVFACRATVSGSYLDIRAAGRDRVAYEPWQLPVVIEQGIRAVTAQFGLTFAAWDLVEDADGIVWALELNPNGQWAFTPDRDDICTAIADHLEEAATR